MIEVAGMSILAKLLFALIGFFLARMSLKHLDKRVGFNFREWINKYKTDKEDISNEKSIMHLAVGIYLSARILAICILFGIIVG
ncbi:MAG: hypothetical protein R3213_11465 [Flavobacteriaceae bacterium]|nr:hypothetical protein [Flavobacteriaceae bacterium]